MKQTSLRPTRHPLAFTLVELIVVITIVWILSTVWFISYSGYLAGARDSNRYSQLTKLSDALQVYASTKSLPLPDDYIEITASGSQWLIAYQGYVWINVMETMDYTNGWQDPKDDSYFTYYLTKDRKNLQLLAFMEETLIKNTLQPNKQTYAADYINRFPKVYGNNLWILVSAEDDTLNIPAQDIPENRASGDLDILGAPQRYTAIFNNDGLRFTGSGYTLWALLSVRMWRDAPDNCPEGFIWVPGNPEFNTQNGFCVAQYEMSYADADTPNSTLYGADYNTVSYVQNKAIVSQAGKYPIVEINQLEAIWACQSMGPGYHLITNNEWMTIARSIEANPQNDWQIVNGFVDPNSQNWNSGTVGVGNIFTGVSGDISLGCDPTWGNAEPRAWATKTWPWDVTCNPRRSHKLSQGGWVIWDLSGNVNEHVNKANTIDGSGFDAGQTSVAGSSAPASVDDDGVYTAVDMQKYGSATGEGRAQGMGNVFGAQGVSNNVLIRGGAANFTLNAGVFAFFLRHRVGYIDPVTGFRCAR